MRFRLVSSPHVTGPAAVQTVMTRVLYALVPGIIAMVWFFGWGVIVHAVIGVATALAIEALALTLRGRPLRAFLTDASAVITALLLVLCLPPLAPWWLTVLGVAFAIGLGKHVYGGLGHNPFNPAMVGYVVLLISFPREMTQWLAPGSVSGVVPGPLDSARAVLTGTLPQSLDALTSATPLDTVKTQLGLNRTVSEIHNRSELFGALGGRGWQWINLAFLAGGGALLGLRVIRWHIPAAMLGSLFALSLVFFLLDPDTHPAPLFHLFTGATMLGAFFIATDPVSAATSDRGRLIYGAGIGVLTYVIRNWGGYPDGVAFGVLLMNLAAPTIDYYTRPRVYGEPPR